jgi:hypothetical protein
VNFCHDREQRCSCIGLYNPYKFNSHNSTYTFDHNLFYGSHPSQEPSDPHKLTGNPALVALGTGGGIGGTNNLSTLSGYKLQAGSPCIGSGLAITTNLIGNPNVGGLDFFGVAVPMGAGTDRGVGEIAIRKFSALQWQFFLAAI